MQRGQSSFMLIYGAMIDTPVLLGGIYQATKAPQDVMNPAKQRISQGTLARTLDKFKVPFNFHPNHPVRTVNALRLLYAVEQSHREKLTDALYHAYWVENADISQEETLLSIVKSLSIPFEASSAIFKDEKHQNALREATSRVVELGAPGVPFFQVSKDDNDKNGAVFWGQDRVLFVETAIKALQAGLDPMDWEKVPNIVDVLESKLKTPSPHVGKGKKVTFYYDFASPWSYLGYTQLYRFKALGCDIDYRPVVVGALFKSIGGPNMPMAAMSDSLRRMQLQDLQNWTLFWKAVMKQSGMEAGKVDKAMQVNWPDKFPIRSIVALRVGLLEPATTDCIYQASWVDNVDVSDNEQLKKILNDNGFDGEKLLQQVADNKDEVKETLFANTKMAIDAGCCGVPSYQVDGDRVLFGQDQYHFIEDLLNGGAKL
ncbi:hypothetical protein INT43_004068 [Umbelopsis isabellina]|uniref:DSBA-like thioredoxin domain-containing protein n=1 Tax=Mortierella isabellina TaxID=91625 RepID=A0A8H7UIG5_MORIS|nr:hypothetical protein INT43_004068 [Umbelopsis isabellina]